MSLASVALGAFIGYFLNKRGVQNERDARERRQLRSAVKGLLTEMNANLKLIEKGPDMALLPPLAKDMWNIHKNRIVELPSEMQTCLYEAYVRIDYVNAVLDIRADVGTRGHGAQERGIPVIRMRLRKQENLLRGRGMLCKNG